MSNENGGVFTSVSEAEAKEINRWFFIGFLGFTAIAVVAHFLVWNWRPWFV